MTPDSEGQTAHPGLDRRPGSMMVRAWGTAPAEGFHAGLAVEDPAEFTAAAFIEALRAAASGCRRGCFPAQVHESARASLPPSARSRSSCSLRDDL
jgi:hypothetical protein